MTEPLGTSQSAPVFVGGAPGAVPDQVAQWLAAALPDHRILPADDAEATPDSAWIHVTRDPVTAIVNDLRLRRFRRIEFAEKRYIDAVKSIEHKAAETRLMRLDLMRLCLAPHNVLPQLEAFLGLKTGALPRDIPQFWSDQIGVEPHLEGNPSRAFQLLELSQNIHWASLSAEVRDTAIDLGYPRFKPGPNKVAQPGRRDQPKSRHMQSIVFARRSNTLGAKLSYQTRDYAAFDYEHWGHDLFAEGLRGPRPSNAALETGAFVASLGAAQTYGRFVYRPYAQIVAEEKGLAVANLATGGAGPKFYLNQPDLLDIANRSRLCLIQVMSGRSADNSVLHDPKGLSRLQWRDSGTRVVPDDAFRHLIGTRSEAEVRAIVQETRDAYVADMKDLLAKIAAPKVLVWISVRSPDYETDYSTVRGIFKGFPQMVNAAMVDELRAALSPEDRFVALSSRRGLPNTLMNRYTGEQTTIPMHNKAAKTQAYYPSQEMHLDLAAQLIEALHA